MNGKNDDVFAKVESHQSSVCETRHKCQQLTFDTQFLISLLHRVLPNAASTAPIDTFPIRSGMKSSDFHKPELSSLCYMHRCGTRIPCEYATCSTSILYSMQCIAPA